jgi:hypothetical protein
MPWPDGRSGAGVFSFIWVVFLQAQVKVKPLVTRLLRGRPISLLSGDAID